jgi:hypothetical protein
MEAIVLEVLAEGGVDLTAMDPKGRTIMHYININGHIREDAKEFLRVNTTLRIDSTDTEGRTSMN